MDVREDMGVFGEKFDPNLMVKFREDEYESRSGSDNFEGISGDDQDAGDQNQRPQKKKYHRHTPFQIQELEAFFKECPHPGEKQRAELSRRLRLEGKQIKFWFQNRRTQMKNQMERHENILLKQDNDRLRAENDILKQTLTDSICNNCGGPVVTGPFSMEQQQIRIENARLKDELSRACALAQKFMGRPLAAPAPPFGSSANLDLAIGTNGFGSLSSMESTLQMGLDYSDGVSIPIMRPMSSAAMGGGGGVPNERSILIDLAMVAMDELIKMAQIDNPLWMKNPDGGKEALNYEEYTRSFTHCIGPRPNKFVSEATRDITIVAISASNLIVTLMDVNRWAEMFSSLVSTASVIDILSSGMGGTKSGALLVMHAEFQVVSPLVPVSQANFLRFCKHHAEGVWAVVDVSVDAVQVGSNPQGFLNRRRLPSGCIIQEMPNGFSKVTWVEHSEYDENAIHQLYRSFIRSGMGFGAQRWLATLQRQCEAIAVLMSSATPTEDQTVISLVVKKSITRLAQRMVDRFCSGVCISSTCKWELLSTGNGNAEMRILTRKSINDPGEPGGVLLSAATSIWLPITQQRLFDFLRDYGSRSKWDVLYNGGPLQEMFHISKGHGRGNSVSLVRSTTSDDDSSGSNVLLLQETASDASGSLVVYAPVDVSSMDVVMNSGDSTYVAILPSGFIILPDDSPADAVMDNGPSSSVKRDHDSIESRGSLLTVGFQILANNLPTAKINVESIETLHNLVYGTIERIKAAQDIA